MVYYEGTIESTYVHCAERKKVRIVCSMRLHLIIKRTSRGSPALVLELRLFPRLKTRLSALCNDFVKSKDLV